jgi:hypothetical protein
MMTIRKQLTVEAPLDRAFRVFTANMGNGGPRIIISAPHP